MSSKNFTAFPVLRTERLRLRQLVNNDAKEIFALRSNENVNKYLDRKPSKTIEDAAIFIQSINKHIQENDSIYWAITLNGANKLIGTICLFNLSDDNLKAEIGYELLPHFQGKGIMQEAISAVVNFGFQQIKLTSIEAYTHSDNHSSTRLLEKFNFKKISAGEGNFMLYQLTLND